MYPTQPSTSSVGVDEGSESTDIFDVLRGSPIIVRVRVCCLVLFCLNCAKWDTYRNISNVLRVQEVIAGGMAGATAKSAVAPLERCKILFQTGKLHSAGVFPTLSEIFRIEGFRGLFRGNGAAVLRIIPYSSIHFGLYEHYRRGIVTAVYGQRADHHGVTPLIDLVAGSASGATAVSITYPLDLVRTRLAYATEVSVEKPMQKQVFNSKTARASHSITGVFLTTVRGEGWRGLYHGIGASMYGILPYAGLKFFVYQHLKQAYIAAFGINAAISGEAGSTQKRLPVPAMLVCGGIAGLIAQTATYPLDVVRRRMQVEGLKHKAVGQTLGCEALPSSTIPALLAILRQQGWRVLYSGLSINYMKVVPSTAIGFTLYDYLKSALDLPTHL